MRVGELGEFALIARLAAVVEGDAESGTLVGIGDDCAVLEGDGDCLNLFTTDTLVECVHFRRDWSSAEDIGWKSLAVNISDIAAMGGQPSGAVISLALPEDTKVEWVDGLYAGLAAAAEEYDCPIVGGDTVASPRVVTITVAMLGAVERRHLMLRSRARAGDVLAVTGDLGASAAGLETLRRCATDIPQSCNVAVDRHRRPRARLRCGSLLASRATAGMDISDGLAGDLQRLTEASGLGCRVRACEVPVADDTRAACEQLGADALECALRGGEDYELLVALPPESVKETSAAIHPTPLTVIGELTPDFTGRHWIDGQGREHPLGSAYDHFRA